MLEPRRVEWRASDGNRPTDVGWQYFGEAPEMLGAYEVKYNEMGLRFSVNATTQSYRIFLPNTLCSMSAVEVDYVIQGTSPASYMTGAPLGVWLPSQTESFFIGSIAYNIMAMSFVSRVPATGTLGTIPPSLTYAQLQRLRVERRGGHIGFVANGKTNTTAPLPVPNNVRAAYNHHMTNDAPLETAITVGWPGTGSQSVWLHRILWEELP
jgi:hypothetical protein